MMRADTIIKAVMMLVTASMGERIAVQPLFLDCFATFYGGGENRRRGLLCSGRKSRVVLPFVHILNKERDDFGLIL